MILYTVTPQHLIFDETVENPSEQQYVTVEYKGVPLLVNKNPPGNYEIVRLLSSDPQHFLDSRYTPGTQLTY